MSEVPLCFTQEISGFFACFLEQETRVSFLAEAVLVSVRIRSKSVRNWYFIAEQPSPAPHLARPEGRAALTHMC